MRVSDLNMSLIFPENARDFYPNVKFVENLQP